MTCPIFYARYYDEKITNASGKASNVWGNLREVFRRLPEKEFKTVYYKPFLIWFVLIQPTFNKFDILVLINLLFINLRVIIITIKICSLIKKIGLQK